jgi:hypothetical protein
MASYSPCDPLQDFPLNQTQNQFNLGPELAKNGLKLAENWQKKSAQNGFQNWFQNWPKIGPRIGPKIGSKSSQHLQEHLTLCQKFDPKVWGICQNFTWD